MLWTRAMRQGMKRREGQAMVLGCLFMLILAIAVLTTVNLGHTIHERVKLQNTADSAAMRRSAPSDRHIPPPYAGPFTAAITGCGSSRSFGIKRE